MVRPNRRVQFERYLVHKNPRVRAFAHAELERRRVRAARRWGDPDWDGSDIWWDDPWSEEYRPDDPWAGDPWAFDPLPDDGSLPPSAEEDAELWAEIDEYERHLEDEPPPEWPGDHEAPDPGAAEDDRALHDARASTETELEHQRVLELEGSTLVVVPNDLLGEVLAILEKSRLAPHR